MAKKKSKHATGKAFSPEVSDAIRHHYGEIDALMSQRSNAFDDRDAALEELAEFDDKHSPEALKLKERHSDAVVLIDGLSKRIRWHENQARETARKADSPEFEFMYDMPPDPPRKKGEDPEQQTLGELDQRPVGRVRGREVKLIQPDGENQHLAAAVGELDIREQLVNKLVSAGLTTVGAVVKVMEKSADETAELQAFIGDAGGKINGPDTKAIAAAVEKYRKKHRKAAMAAERGE